MGWYSTGYSEGSKESQRAPVNSNKHMPKRLNVRLGEQAQVLFIDGLNTMFTFWERQYYHNGSFYNYTPHLTRNKGIPDPETGLTYAEDPLDRAYPYIKGDTRPGSKVYHTGLLTVALLSGFKHDDGTVTHKGIRQLFPAKFGKKYTDPKTGEKKETVGVADLLKKKFDALKRKSAYKNLDDIVGCVFDVSRRDDKSPSCGDEFEFVEFYDKTQWAKLAAEAGVENYDKYPWTPFKYSELIQPMSLADATQLADEIMRQRRRPNSILIGNRHFNLMS